MQTHAQERGPHVFAIDASPELLILMRQFFEEEGFRLTTALPVPDAFDQISTLRPDVILVDLVPGEQESWDLLERLHAGAATSNIPVLLLSTSEALLAQAQTQVARYGGHASLHKPFDLDELLRTVHLLMRKP